MWSCVFLPLWTPTRNGAGCSPPLIVQAQASTRPRLAHDRSKLVRRRESNRTGSDERETAVRDAAAARHVEIRRRRKVRRNDPALVEEVHHIHLQNEIPPEATFRQPALVTQQQIRRRDRA